MRVIGILIPADGFVNLYNLSKAECQCVTWGKLCICFRLGNLISRNAPESIATSSNPCVHKDIQQSIIYNLETGNGNIYIPYIINIQLFL